jgi:hypothetical protein
MSDITLAVLPGSQAKAGSAISGEIVSGPVRNESN